jgi:hypothetical protein
MYDQDSQEPQGNSQDGSDLGNRVNGLMSSLGKRTNERDIAIARAEAAEADLAIVTAALESRPEPRMDANNPRRQPAPPPDPIEGLRNTSWSGFGFEEPRSR